MNVTQKRKRADELIFTGHIFMVTPCFRLTGLVSGTAKERGRILWICSSKPQNSEWKRGSTAEKDQPSSYCHQRQWEKTSSSFKRRSLGAKWPDFWTPKFGPRRFWAMLLEWVSMYLENHGSRPWFQENREFGSFNLITKLPVSFYLSQTFLQLKNQAFYWKNIRCTKLKHQRIHQWWYQMQNWRKSDKLNQGKSTVRFIIQIFNHLGKIW